jgi:hypothetical protein
MYDDKGAGLKTKEPDFNFLRHVSKIGTKDIPASTQRLLGIKQASSPSAVSFLAFDLAVS